MPAPAEVPPEVPAEPEQAVPVELPVEPEPQAVAEPPAEPEPEQQAAPAEPELQVAPPPPAEPEAAAPPPVQQHPVCTGALHTAALDNIVPAGHQWEHVKATVAAVWQGQRPEPNRVRCACVGTAAHAHGARSSAGLVASARWRSLAFCRLPT